MSKKEFKAESKRLLNLMINSIYSNKEIFLRELISNASDAIDKLNFISLTDKKLKVNREDFAIRIDVDKEHNILTISDNGIGMNEEELEKNLGTIAESGTLLFKEENKDKVEDCIGQFGVGFYSAFMVSKKIEVTTRRYDSKDAYLWESDGVDGYTITKTKKDDIGTTIKLYLKDDTEDEMYSKYSDDFTIQGLVKKYSDYIKYPIKMMITHEKLKEGSKEEYAEHTDEHVINSMVPIWKEQKSKVKDEDYDKFYMDEFYDYKKPLKVIHASVEGKVSYDTLMFIPSQAPHDFYSKDYEKGLALYSNGVLIKEKVSELIPEYFSFVRGLVDTPDVSLNISREMVQQDSQIKVIANSLESRIKKELEAMLKDEREKYEEFFKAFGINIKFGIYNSFGQHKDLLKNLLLFYSSKDKKLITLKEYVENKKKDQDKIYYACGETLDKIDLLPQTEKVKELGYEILYLNEYVDEFVVQILQEYDGLKFVNISSEALDLDSEEDKKELEKLNKKYQEMFDEMKKIIDVKEVRFTKKLKKHPVCLTSDGAISVEMEKVINAMPTDQKIKAQLVLEVNADHKVAKKLQSLYKEDKKKLDKYTKILYNQARLIEGLPVEDPTELASLVCEVIAD